MLDSGATDNRRKVVNLYHHRRHSFLAPLRVGLSSINESRLARPDLSAHAVRPCDPAYSLNGCKQLTKAGRMGPDDAAPLEPQQECTRFAAPLPYFHGTRGTALELTNGLGEVGIKPEN